LALRFNRGFKNSIRAISFDLDDTLYFNEDVIQRAELAQFSAICQLVPAANALGIDYWQSLKWSVLTSEPELYHDVTVWREAVLTQGLRQLGVTAPELSRHVQQVFQIFYEARSDFEVPEQSFQVLSKLAERFPLVAVTNGNADINRLGLAKYFVGYYRAGENNTRSKPYPDMLALAARDLDINPNHILHIGDSLGSDIKGALNAGCMSLWFNPSGEGGRSGQNLADGEFSSLDDLLHLL